MAKQEYEFTLILSGVSELTREVLDALYESGCDDALIGMRDGTAYAEFCREADSFQQAVLSAIRDVEAAGLGIRVEHVEPDELVTMSEIARRLRITREGVRKRVAGLRGPGGFPPPAGSLTQRSPLWHWTDVVRWHQEKFPKEQVETLDFGFGAADVDSVLTLGAETAALNAALDLRKRVPLEAAVKLLRDLTPPERVTKPMTKKAR
jgi:hypothetical protein